MQRVRWNRRPVFWFTTAWFFVYLAGLPLLTATSLHALRDVLFFVVLYSLLAFLLTGSSCWLTACGRAPGLGAVLFAGGLLAWHFREQTGLPEPMWLFLAIVALLAFLWMGVVAAISRRISTSHLPQWLAAAGCVFAALFVFSYRSSNTIRWHLLQQHRLLGTPAYYLMSPSVKSLRAELWSQALQRPGLGEASRLEKPAACRPTNVIFVMLDTWRRDSLAVYGGERGSMPELDRLTHGAYVFQDVLANASWTRPTVASYFTGLLPEEHGAIDRDLALSEDCSTLTEVLRDRGFSTAAFVTNYAAVGRDSGLHQGFDWFYELKAEGQAYGRAGRLNRDAMRWMDENFHRGKWRNRPVFLYLHYLDPHTPYYSGGEQSVIPSVSRAAYEAELRYLDGKVKEMIDFLSAGLAGDSVIVIASDHGEEFGEHGDQGHGHSLYSELVRIPVVVLAKTAGRRNLVAEKLESRDFFDLIVKLSCDPYLDVRRWASDKEREERYTSLYLTNDMALHRPYRDDLFLRALERDSHFLIWSAYGPTLELYDRRSDPEELVNLARSKPGVAAALQRRMEDHVASWARLSPSESSQDAVEQLRSLGYVH